MKHYSKTVSFQIVCCAVDKPCYQHAHSAYVEKLITSKCAQCKQDVIRSVMGELHTESGSESCNQPAQEQREPQTIEDMFWGFCEDNLIIGNLKIQTKDGEQRLDDLVVEFVTGLVKREK